MKAFERVKVLADELVAEGSYHPTYFEMLFLMGMVIFAGGRGGLCDFWKPGLGGRLDATTAVENPCGLRDHIYQSGSYAVLGIRIREIAGRRLESLFREFL